MNRLNIYIFSSLILALTYTLLLTGCAVERPPICWKNGQPFGHTKDKIISNDWDSLYRRGISYSKGECWEQAISQFFKAILQRPDDQWFARTYGMIVLDEYFPHRELGIAYLKIGRIEESITEFENSLRTADSAKTKYYLNKARREWLKKSGLDLEEMPTMMLLADCKKSGEILLTNTSSYIIEGKATDNFFVFSVQIDGIPIPFDLAQPEIHFRKKVELVPGLNSFECKVTDLIGHEYEKEIQILLDRQGPTVIFSPVFNRNSIAKDVKGVIFDDGGLDELIIGEVKITLAMDKNVQKFTVDLSTINKRPYFKAKDITGNITEGELYWILEENKKVDTGWGNSDPKPSISHQSFRVCSNDIFFPLLTQNKLDLKDRTPRIYIKDYPPFVYEPRIVIQGWAESSDDIKEVWINNQPVISETKENGFINALRGFILGERTHYYFTRIIEGLKEGNNRLSIWAKDSRGKSAEKEIIVNYKIRECKKIGNRWCLAILPFDKYEMDKPFLAPQKPGNLLSLDASLHYFFYQTERFNLVERDRIDALMYEKELNLFNNLSKETYNDLGELLIAEVLLTGIMQEIWDEKERILKIIARFIDVDTGQILAIKDAYNQWMTIQDEEHLLAGLVQKFLEEFPLLQGRVNVKKMGEIELSLGERDLIKKDMDILVYRQDDNTNDDYIIGEACIKKVYETYSKAIPHKKNLLDSIRVGDMFITK